jgi:hypothetical protein
MRLRRADADHDGYTTLAGIASIALAVLGLLLHGLPPGHAHVVTALAGLGI